MMVALGQTASSLSLTGNISAETQATSFARPRYLSTAFVIADNPACWRPHKADVCCSLYFAS